MSAEKKSETDTVKKLLRDKKMVQVENPAYSPDLSPCNFSLSETEKAGHKYSSSTWKCKFSVTKDHTKSRLL